MDAVNNGWNTCMIDGGVRVFPPSKKLVLFVMRLGLESCAIVIAWQDLMDKDFGQAWNFGSTSFFKELDLTGPQLCPCAFLLEVLKLHFCKLPYPMDGGTPERCSKAFSQLEQDQLSKMVDFKNDCLEEDSFIWTILITAQEMQRCNDLLRSESGRLV